MKTHVLRRRMTAMAVLGGLLFAATACGDTYTIEGHIIATAVARSTNGPCYRLVATAGDPVAGYAATSPYGIDAGFQAMVRDETLFFDSFEECAQ